MSTNSLLTSETVEAAHSDLARLLALKNGSGKPFINLHKSLAAPDFIGESSALRKPTELLTSARWPGRKFLEIGLAAKENADEALAVQLLTGVSNDPEGIVKRVMELRELLMDSKLASTIVSTAVLKPNVTLQRGVTLVPEGFITDTVRLLVGNDKHEYVATVYGQIIGRALIELGIVSTNPTAHVVLEDESFVMPIASLGTAYVCEQLKPALSTALLKTRVRDVDIGKKTAAAVAAQRIGDALAAMAQSLLVVVSAAEEFTVAMSLLRKFYLAPEALPSTLRSSAELTALANFANFLPLIQEADWGAGQLEAYEWKHALQSVYTGLMALPSVQRMTVEAFAELFLVTPAISPKNIVRGASVMLPLGQVPEGRVFLATTESAGEQSVMMEQMSPSISALPVIAEITAKTIVAKDYTLAINHMLSNLVLLAGDPDTVTLTSVGCGDMDLFTLAIAKARDISVGDVDGTKALIYGVDVSAVLETQVVLGVGRSLYLLSATDVIAATASADFAASKPVPQRPQSMPRTFVRGRVLNWGVEDLTTSIQKPFVANLQLDTGAETLALELQFAMTGRLPDLATEKSRLATVYEVGVASEVTSILAIVATLLASKSDVIRLQAITWFARVLTIAMQQPRIQRLAENALQRAILMARVDARSLAPFSRRAYAQAMIAAYIAGLVRGGWLPGGVSASLLAAVNHNDMLIAMADNIPSMETTISNLS